MSHISPEIACDVLEKWASESLPVCFAVSMGNLAWHAHWVGSIRNALDGRWVLTANGTTNVVCPYEFKEIILIEDPELLGMRFRSPNGSLDSDFEVNLFVAKAGRLDGDAQALMEKMIQ